MEFGIGVRVSRDPICLCGRTQIIPRNIQKEVRTRRCEPLILIYFGGNSVNSVDGRAFNVRLREVCYG